MAKEFGYWSDAGVIALDEHNNSWIQAIPLGKWNHPVYGTLDFTKEKAAEFAASVKNKVRGQDLDIDYDHKEDPSKGSKAAGWVKDAEVRDDGLYLNVDWTDDAAESIRKKEYKYISPELADEWEHPSLGTKFKNVVFGAALTNRPFLKGILPVNLSELFAEEPIRAIGSLFDEGVTAGGNGFDNKGFLEAVQKILDEGQNNSGEGDNMDPKELRKLLGLAENATDEDVTKKLGELTTTPKTNPYEGMSVEQVVAKLMEQGKNPGLKALTELLKAQQDQLTLLSDQRAELAADAKIKAFEEEITNPRVELTDDLKIALREIILNSPAEISDQVLDSYKATLNLGLIDVTKGGWQTRAGMSSATDRFMSEVLVAQKEDKTLSFADASTKVARENPALARAYHDEAFAQAGS